MADDIGSLIDKLITVNVKVYHLVDIIEQETDDKKVAEAARKAQKLNRQRSALVNEINQTLKDGSEVIKL